MADSPSDPALLFSPSRLSSLTPEESSTLSPPHLAMSTRRKVQCYVALPLLPPSIKGLYQPAPDYLGGDPEFVRNDLDGVVGEYPLDGKGRPSHYFVRFKDGLARRISSHTFLAHYSDLVDDYQRRKAEGLLDHFDPASDDVHEHSRTSAKIMVNAVSYIAASRSSPESDVSQSPLPSDSPLTEEDDDSGDNEDYTSRASIRKSTRLAASNEQLIQSKLPFSPQKLRNNRIQREPLASDSEDDLGGYSQVDSDVEMLAPRRSTRSRRSARSNLADDLIGDGESDGDTYYDSPRRKSRKKEAGKRLRKKRSATARPAYGHFRDIDDLDFHSDEDEATSSLRAHRDICEKCHKRPSHEQLTKAKKGRRKTKDDEGESDDNDEDYIRGLGGWVRCLKCPVVAHWKCLAKTQRDEITRAARARDKDQWKAQAGADSEPSTGDLPDRKELDINQTTEFICGLCMKGGICMGCLTVALEPDPSLANKHPPGRTSLEPVQSDIPDIEVVDTASPTIREDTLLQPSQELLFRCFSCRRLAHYRHLPDPQNAAWGNADLASYYQVETGWRCANCASYVYPLDKILAWRPYPPGVVEPTTANPPDAKASLPREYLVKWADRSYRRTQWVPHMWLVSTNLSKLKHFLFKGSKVPLLDELVSDEAAMDVDKLGGIDRQSIPFEPSADVTPEFRASTEPKHPSLGPLPDAERRIPPAWKTIDRVLDVRFWNPSSSMNGKHKKKGVSRGQVDDSPLSPRQQLERAYAEGEQPDDSLMGELDGWLSRTGQVLLVEHIDEIIWVFVKWKDLGYEEATWDSPPRRGEPGYSAYERAFQHFIDSRKVSVQKTRKDIDARVENGYGAFALKRDLDEQPDLGQSNHLKLMKFQIDGYNWLCDNWWNRQPSILADEMGLGKTVQIATFLGTLVEKFSAAPALVVVPNSTITNWVREFSRWAPRLRVVPFFGEAKSRDVVMRYELFHEPKREPKYHVLVTTYETVTNPRDFTTVFKSVGRWEILVVDEGQRLKSDNSLLFKKLNELKPIHRIIMTGTPLNNNIRELFNLMNFLDRDKWRDLEALEKEYEELSEDLVRQLHMRLKPYFLRRIKSEVLQLPPKNEVIVPVSMAPLQKEIYRSILSQNLDILKHLTQVSTVTAGRAGTSKTNMNNMLMQLRKCIQHPYLISDDIEPRGLDPREAHEKLIDASAKLRLLRSLLSKLKARGHRVLLFSQFVIALDVIEDFLRGENYKYLRLDGETKQAARQKGMDEFNSPNSEYFIYLLTTRAGGVGINLSTADTVIVYDPDFNPHQDLQAIARSHRYGQQKTCLVFKLMVKDSAEERIMQASKKKLVLDHLIVQKMDDDENGGDDLRSILTFGARALFEEGDQGSKDIVYSDHDLDKLIERTEVGGDERDVANEPGLKFNFAKIWAAEKDVLEDVRDTVPDIDQGDSWAQALERIAAKKDAAKEKEATGRGVRRKAAAAFPQQQLDFLDGPEDTPAKVKGKKKGRLLKSGTSSDSDAYDASAHHSAGADSDATTESVDVDQEHPLIPAWPKTQPHNSSAPFPAIQSGPTLPYHDIRECGLCGRSHGPGACSMMHSTPNLIEYRQILLNHTEDEPWEYRKAAIEAIEQALYSRGQGNLLAGQPLKLVSKPESASMSVKTNERSNRHVALEDHHELSSKMFAHRISPPPQQVVAYQDNRGSLQQDRGSIANRHSTLSLDRSLPMVLPSKRMSSPDGVPENLSKKQKQTGLSGCPVCLGPQHSIENCPVFHQDTHSITKHILRLSQDPSQGQVVKKLRRLLKQRKREAEEVGQSGHEKMQTLP